MKRQIKFRWPVVWLTVGYTMIATAVITIGFPDLSVRETVAIAFLYAMLLVELQT